MSRTLGPSTRAVLSAVAAALLALACLIAWPLTVALIAVLLLAFCIGWPRLVDLPARVGRAILLLLVAGAAIAAVLVDRDLRHLAAVGAFGVIGSFVLELTRRDGRPRLVDSLAASTSGVVAVLSGAAWIAMGTEPLAVAVVVTTAASLAAGAAMAAIHLAPWPHALLTIAVATAVGAGAGLALPALGWVGALVGLATGLLSAAVHQTLGRYPAAGRPLAALAAAVLPVVVVGLPAYALARFYLV